MATKSLADYAVLLSKGSDLETVTALFTQDLQAHVELEKATNEAILTEFNALYDRYPGARMNIPCVVSGILTALKVQPTNFGEMSKRVNDFLHAAEEAGIVKIEKGKKGGVTRVLAPKPAEAPVAE